ncbi:MAG: hypothetical protein AB7P76_05650 [Candidatus Melainabacteria bacterium]
MTSIGQTTSLCFGRFSVEDAGGVDLDRFARNSRAMRLLRKSYGLMSVDLRNQTRPLGVPVIEYATDSYVPDTLVVKLARSAYRAGIPAFSVGNDQTISMAFRDGPRPATSFTRSRSSGLVVAQNLTRDDVQWITGENDFASLDDVYCFKSP